MLLKYLGSLGALVLVVTFAALSLRFVTRAQILNGTSVDENPQLEFTIDADSDNTYKISPRIQQFLEQSVTFYSEGPVHLASTKVDITPKKVSWTENRRTITSTGAALTAHLRWEVPASSENGAQSYIYVKFPDIPWLPGKTMTIRSGGYQKDDSGRFILREVTSYSSNTSLMFARFLFAVVIGLPGGILLHSIIWIFVLRSEKRLRKAALPLNGTEWPQTFYPDPIAEWIVWLLVFGIGGFVCGMLATFSAMDGFMSSSLMHFEYGMLAVVTAIAFVCVYFMRRTLLTVRVEAKGFSYARGRGDPEWMFTTWSNILSMTPNSRTYRGNTTHWIEVEFNDERKKLKIRETIEGYPVLRDLLKRMIQA